MAVDVKSILIYFGALGLTLLSLQYCSKIESKSKLRYVVAILIAALPLSIVAGLRDLSVGTDSYNYAMIFREIYNYSFLECVLQTKFEPVFVLYVKTVSVIFGEDVGITFFAAEFISLVVLFFAFLNIKDKLNPCFAFFIYFLTFYHSSLNVIRQGLALSFIAFMLAKLMNKKYIQASIALAVAVGIHLSSIIAVLFLCAAFLLKNYKYLSLKRLFYFYAYLAIFGVFFIGWNYIFNLSIFASYSKYTGMDADIGVGVFVIGVLYFALPLLLCRKEMFGEYESELIFDVALLYVPIAFLGYFAKYAARLNMFPQIAVVLFIAHLLHKTKNKYYRWYLICLYVGLFSYDYIKNYWILNQTNAYPYLFNV